MTHFAHFPLFLFFSIGWLRLLHHCLTHISDLEGMMASAAAPTANLLQTCAALLMSPYCGMHSPNIEAVLVKIGLQSTRIGLKLIDILLRNCSASGSDPAGECIVFLFNCCFKSCLYYKFSICMLLSEFEFCLPILVVFSWQRCLSCHYISGHGRALCLSSSKIVKQCNQLCFDLCRIYDKGNVVKSQK